MNKLEKKLINFNETKKFKQGREGEKYVSELLQRKGWYVIESYNYVGENQDKAPKLHGFSGNYILPDLDISKMGVRFWVEVKTKERPTFTRSTQQLEHGMPYRHYRDYKKIQVITGIEVYIFINEENNKVVLYRLLDELDSFKREYRGKKMSYDGMVFWPRNKFHIFKK